MRGENMAYQFRQEEADKWTTTVWHKKSGDVDVTKIPASYANNLKKFIEKRYNEKYTEMYIQGSVLWNALCKRVEQ